MNIRTHSTRYLRQLGRAIFAAGLTLMLSGSHTPTALEKVLQRGELTILSRNGPTTYYEGPHGLDGFEYALASGFADYLGVDLRIAEVEHLGSLLHAVQRERGDLAAAGLTMTDKRRRQVQFSRPYMHVSQQLLYRAGSDRPASAADLVGKTILVISDSAHVDTLRQLQQQHPQLRWHEQSNLEMVELIEMVHDGDIDLTVVDSNAYELNRALYPLARVAFELSDPQPLAWALPRGVDDSLLQEANAYLAQADAAGLIDQLRERHLSRINNLDIGSALTFARRLQSRLPRWQEHLQAAAEEFDLDWRLLAAISYQESHWNPRAQSYTGVRGLMMLTRTTAREMGIENRLDPVQSIRGGARYFRKLYDRLPAGVQGDDRRWMALAAYNVGFGHLQDARVITERQGGDPNRWEDVRTRLPLLAKRKHYSTVRHGYARGWEPVTYVRNIRSYFNTIAWHQQIKQSRLASSRDDLKAFDNLTPPVKSTAQADSGTTLL